MRSVPLAPGWPPHDAAHNKDVNVQFLRGVGSDDGLFSRVSGVQSGGAAEGGMLGPRYSFTHPSRLLQVTHGQGLCPREYLQDTYS